MLGALQYVALDLMEQRIRLGFERSLAASRLLMPRRLGWSFDEISSRGRS